jgi:glycosyltransferase involved in cell wall biosynthesis
MRETQAKHPQNLAFSTALLYFTPKGCKLMDVSVVIPVYNSRSTIIECIESVVAECCANPIEWELILVDDGSRDDSVEIMTGYISSSPHGNRIKLIRQSNGGPAKARNTGLRAAEGRFIALNDSDDRWLPGRIATQMGYFANHPETELTGGIRGMTGSNGVSLKRLGYATRIDIGAQILKNYFIPPTVMFRAGVLEKAGYFDENMRYAEDACFFYRVVSLCNSVYIKERFAASIVGKAEWGDRGLSGNLVAMERGELQSIVHTYHNGSISRRRFLFAYGYSVAKFIRRFVISGTRKIIGQIGHSWQTDH